VTLLLAGCTAEIASHTAKQSRADKAKPEDRGVYKIGAPYRINGRLYRPTVDYAYVETGIASWYGRDFHGKRTANGEIFDMNRISAAHRTLPLPSMVRVTNLENGRTLVVRVSDRGPFARERIIDLSRKAAQTLGFYEKGTARVRVQLLAKESRELALRAQRDGKVGGDPVTMASLGGDTVIGNSGTDMPSASGGLWRNPDLRPVPGSQRQDDVTVEDLPPAGRPAADKPAHVVSIGPGNKGTGEKLFIQAGAFRNFENASRLRLQLGGLAPTAIDPLDRGKQRLYRVRLGPLRSISEADRVLDSLAAKGHVNATIVVEESSAICGLNVSSTLTKC
jgi:rare lipoprotein A